MESVATGPRIDEGIYTSLLGILLLVLLSALLFGLGYYLRRRGKLGGGAGAAIWSIIAIVPLAIALYLGYGRL